jgi:small subunit ribosomal protein S17
MNKKPEEKKTEAAKGKTLTGVVVSAKTPMTAIIAVVSSFRHPLYKKAVKKTKHFAAHNTTLELVVGDKVMIRETRPITRTKHFVVVEKLK